MTYAIVKKDHTIWDMKNGFDHTPYDWYEVLKEVNFKTNSSQGILKPEHIAMVLRDGEVLFVGGEEIIAIANGYMTKKNALLEKAESDAKEAYPEPPPVVEGGRGGVDPTLSPS